VDTGDKIKIGTSGFSFKDWRGPFYPDGLKHDRMLEYYSNFFDVVEINATYYRIPPASAFADMARRTDPDFKFAVKLHQSMTHERDGDLSPFRQFEESIGPLAENGRLYGLLAQFPAGFKFSEDNLSYLLWIRLKLERHPFFAEFRDSSWLRPETLEAMRGNRIGWCCVDEPQLKGLLPPAAEHTTDTAYVRFHGRNDTDWHRPRPGSDRYNYEYSERELAEWVPKIMSLAGLTEKTLVFFNNCHFGHAPKNAKMMKEMLGIPQLRPRRKGELSLDG
jgi:uncharacterized protein YecE (DUF72 family)